MLKPYRARNPTTDYDLTTPARNKSTGEGGRAGGREGLRAGRRRGRGDHAKSDLFSSSFDETAVNANPRAISEQRPSERFALSICHRARRRRMRQPVEAVGDIIRSDVSNDAIFRDFT